MPYKDPERQRAYQREHKRLERAGECRTPGRTLLPTPFRLRTARDVLALLEEQVAAVRDDPDVGTLEKARCVAYLAVAALRAIEAGDLAGRLEALEGVLKARRTA